MHSLLLSYYLQNDRLPRCTDISNHRRRLKDPYPAFRTLQTQALFLKLANEW